MLNLKLDDSLPIVQFSINGFRASCQIDRNPHGSGIIFYLAKDAPSKLLIIEKDAEERFSY